MNYSCHVKHCCYPATNGYKDEMHSFLSSSVCLVTGCCFFLPIIMLHSCLCLFQKMCCTYSNQSNLSILFYRPSSTRGCCLTNTTNKFRQREASDRGGCCCDRGGCCCTIVLVDVATMFWCLCICF